MEKIVKDWFSLISQSTTTWVRLSTMWMQPMGEMARQMAAWPNKPGPMH